jgi:high-affinity Fe2+/Pb2+ permease
MGDDVAVKDKVRIGLWMAASAGVGVVVTAFLTSPAASKVDWEASGTWAGALMTAVAAGIALGITLHDSKQRDRARRDDGVAQALTPTVTVDKGSGEQVW